MNAILMLKSVTELTLSNANEVQIKYRYGKTLRYDILKIYTKL